MRVNYEIVSETHDELVIKDVGPWTNSITITNAAEQVVAELHARGVLGDRQLFYYDSEGVLSELLHLGPTFYGFGPAKPSHLESEEERA